MISASANGTGEVASMVVERKGKARENLYHNMSWEKKWILFIKCVKYMTIYVVVITLS